MPKNRPSLSPPTYSSLTGTINWSRGIGEQLATPTITSFVPAPTPAPAPAPAPFPSGSRGVGCVDVEAWVIKRGWFGRRRAIQAGRVKVGDRLLLVGNRWGKVTYSVTKAADRVRIETGDGTLTCSLSAPLQDANGVMVLAPAAAYRILCAMSVHGLTTRLVSAVTRMGAGRIQHITCENDYFWAGDDPRLMLAHHNMKKIENY